ncbi:trypsin-like peptidase domain-containing protein [Bifidobacterium sp. ESL0775]|uniref:S1C family serine protease n=1 Tax=Bifidobacterium sp. ESL0775 TaxID=2983230 RepID=UPI0023F7A810|nr:trypsin-like peptidase domain-containing protein [Bifidobacterium sp. ESL0775]WEV69479.1 trypsin-like peptidase domain-containing protein [Bifidobacterium sp. ESL0775]
MAEDNKDEWSGGQPARPNEDTNTNNAGATPNFVVPSFTNNGNADSSVQGTGSADEAQAGEGADEGNHVDGGNAEPNGSAVLNGNTGSVGNAESSGSADTQSAATQNNDTQNFNTSNFGSAPTEVFSTDYRPDDADAEDDGLLTGFGPSSYTSTSSSAPASSRPAADDTSASNDSGAFASTSGVSDASNTEGLSASEMSSDSPYRPAPEYGAYGPVPNQNGNNGNANTQNGSGNTGNTMPWNAPGNNGPQSSPNMPWNGIFGGNGNNANSGQNVNGGGNGNGYGNPYNNAPGQPGGANRNGNVNGGNFGGPNMPNGNGYGNPGGYGNGNGGNGNGTYGQTKSHSNIITAIVAAVVTAALCLGIGFAAISNGWITIPSSSSMSGITSNKSGSGSATVKGGQAPDWAAVSSKVSDSVVSITTQVSQGIAKGSGAVIDDKGHIVTNNHVISGGQNIQVTLSNGQMYKANVVGTDSTTDLAVVQIQNAPSSLKPVEFADSSKLAVGENVMAVGNPLGYDDTATTGIVSALNRPVSVMDDNNSEIVTNAVQIDAAINPGNSGGPTFNAAGQVIGINSSIASASSSSGESGSIGIGFAIPSNLVKRVADEIVSKGSVQHAMLGVTIKSANVEADGITRGGAEITTPSTGGSAVVKGSPADKAGLKANDTVVAFNDQAVGSSSALLGYVRAASLGDKVKLTIVRGGKTMDVEVTLDQKESDVKGNNRSENQKKNGNGQNGQGNGNGNGQNGDGNNGDGDGGGLFDPFGLW